MFAINKVGSAYFIASTLIALIVVPLSSEVWAAAMHFPATQLAAEIELESMRLPSINFTNIFNHLRYLSSLNRYTGYPGYEEAASYIFNYFNKTLGLKTWVEEYEIAVPYDFGSKVIIEYNNNLETINAYALLPNNVQTCFGNYSGHLVYGGLGTLTDLNKVNDILEGSVVLLEFNSGYNWINVMRLGAKAVIFIAPDDTIRSECDWKNLDIPIKFPRVYVMKEDGKRLKELALSGKRVNVTVSVNMKWIQVKAKNIIAVLNGTIPSETENTIAIMAYYDSASIIPSISPGAEEAIGISALLELARLLVQRSPKRPVWFIAFSGHNQGMAGGRDFIWHAEERISDSSGYVRKFVWHFDHIGTTEDRTLCPYAIKMAISLDFSSDSDAIAVLGYGSFYGLGGPWYSWYSYDKDLTNFIFTGGRYGSYEPSTGIYVLKDKVLPLNATRKVYRVFGLWASQLELSQYLPTAVFYEAEIFARTGIWGICFSTALSTRLLYNTPFNTFERVNFSNIIPQIEFSFSIINMILNDISWFDFSKVFISGGQKEAAFFTHKHKDDAGIGYAVVIGRVGIWNITKNWYEYNWTSIVGDGYDLLLSVRIVNRPDLYGHFWIQTADMRDGTFILKGLLPSLGWAAALAEYEVLPFLINRTTGDIEYAPDMGPYGTYLWPHGNRFLTFEDPLIDGSGSKIVNLAAFKACTIALHDLFDPRTLLTPTEGTQLRILDVNDAELIQYSYLISAPPTFESRERVILGDPTSGYTAVLFVPPGGKIKILFVSGQNILGILTNNENGIEVSQKYIDLVPTSELFVKDLLNIVKNRMYYIPRGAEESDKFAYINRLFSQAINEFEESLELKKQKRYGDYYLNLLKAWCDILMVYSEVKNILMDISITAMFFFILLVPFSILFERLVFHFEGSRRVLAVIAIALGSLFTFFTVQPGFRAVPFSMISAFGFICFTLAILILIFMLSETSGILKELRSKLLGVTLIRIDVLGSLVLSFSAAIENMRKRWIRTFLTLFALIIITFASTSLISINPMVTFIQMPTGHVEGRYQGVLVTGTDFFAPINPDLFFLAKKIAGKEAIVTARAIIPLDPRGSYLYSEKGKYTLIAGVFGFMPEERAILRLNDAILEEFGNITALREWFLENDTYVCFITEDIANELGVRPGDYVIFYGIKLKVLGIISQQRLRAITDIDGNPVAPFDPYSQLPPRPRVFWGIVFIPYKLAMSLGGVTYSVALSCNKSSTVIRIAIELTEHIGLLSHYVFMVHDITLKTSYRYTLERAFDVANWQFFVVPLIICALVLLSTMMANIYERTKEIYVFSALGLNPMDVVGLFLGENFVFALISAPASYLLTCILGSYHSMFANYASSAVIIAVTSSVLATLSSAIYPLYKVSKLVTPSLERVWRPPTKPTNGTWIIPLPIAIGSEDEAIGFLLFMIQYLKSIGSEAADFIIEKEEFEKKIEENELIYTCKTSVRLKPYESGLSEDVIFRVSRVKHHYMVTLVAVHKYGPRSLWTSGHVRFVDNVRKAMLTWITMEMDRKTRYSSMGKEVFR